MIIAREVAPLSCAKLERIWNADTLKKPAIITWIYSPRGTFRLYPVMMAATNRVAAPMLDPTTRRLQGDTSRNATAAEIQLNPQANASKTTSSLAVVAARPFTFCTDIVSGNRCGGKAASRNV